MSRYVGDWDVTDVLKASYHWRKNCLEKDGSVFQEDSLWILENFRELDKFFIQNLDNGDGNFFQKLETQLEATAPRVKKLAAEMLWVMFLCPSNIRPQTKRDGIQKLWQWSEEKFPETSTWLQDGVLLGAGSSGTAYNTNRWRELVYLIRLMIALKELGAGDRSALLDDGWKMDKWLEKLEENESRQFRHMFLFLLFPDQFERIFGGTDRKKIIGTFLNFSKAKVNKLSAFEIDEYLAEIRKEQETIYKTEELDFYLPSLMAIWGDTPNSSWLFTWNPDSWSWDSFSSDRNLTHGGKTVTLSLTCLNKNIKVGDKAYLNRVEIDPKGIIAVGNIITAPHEKPQWEEAKAANGENRWSVDINFSSIQDPSQGDRIITAEELQKITIDQQNWTSRDSGIEIKTRSAVLLQKLWKEKTVIPHSPLEKEAVNLIMFGPPGTGKTHELNRKIIEYTSKRRSMDRDAWLIQELLEVRWFDVVAAALHSLGGRARVGEIKDHEFIRLKAQAMGRDKTIAQTIWGTLQQHASETSQTVNVEKRSHPFVFDKTIDSVWFLIPEWQEECADLMELADAWIKGPAKEIQQHRYEFVTFHQAYSYEDFVEGIRPVQDKDSGELAYHVVPGAFRRIAGKAKADPGQRYAIFIDEINRGNISKIFGELITLIEPDKRAVYSSDGKLISGMEATLPYSGDRFGVPRNLDVYGAMNTADRSIALLDTALRRRFRFKELMPNPGLISGSLGDGYIEDGEGGLINLRALLETMNLRIRFLLNRDMMLGHAYFYDVRDFKGLKDVLLNQVIPLLQEYFYGDWLRIQLVFRDIGPLGEKLEPQIICSCILDKQAVLGFDHDDYGDMVDYSVADEEEITPSAVRKIYEEDN